MEKLKQLINLKIEEIENYNIDTQEDEERYIRGSAEIRSRPRQAQAANQWVLPVHSNRSLFERHSFSPTTPGWHA